MRKEHMALARPNGATATTAGPLADTHATRSSRPRTIVPTPVPTTQPRPHADTTTASRLSTSTTTCAHMRMNTNATTTGGPRMHTTTTLPTAQTPAPSPSMAHPRANAITSPGTSTAQTPTQTCRSQTHTTCAKRLPRKCKPALLAMTPRHETVPPTSTRPSPQLMKVLVPAHV